MTSQQRSAVVTVDKILATDFACEERDLDEEGVFAYQAREIEGARRFALPERFLAVVTAVAGDHEKHNDMLRNIRFSQNGLTPSRQAWEQTDLLRKAGHTCSVSPQPGTCRDPRAGISLLCRSGRENERQ